MLQPIRDHRIEAFPFCSPAHVVGQGDSILGKDLISAFRHSGSESTRTPSMSKSIALSFAAIFVLQTLESYSIPYTMTQCTAMSPTHLISGSYHE